jgi:hypothetical protein
VSAARLGVWMIVVGGVIAATLKLARKASESSDVLHIPTRVVLVHILPVTSSRAMSMRLRLLTWQVVWALESSGGDRAVLRSVLDTCCDVADETVRSLARSVPKTTSCGRDPSCLGVALVRWLVCVLCGARRSRCIVDVVPCSFSVEPGDVAMLQRADVVVVCGQMSAESPFTTDLLTLLSSESSVCGGVLFVGGQGLGGRRGLDLQQTFVSRFRRDAPVLCGFHRVLRFRDVSCTSVLRALRYIGDCMDFAHVHTGLVHNPTRARNRVGVKFALVAGREEFRSWNQGRDENGSENGSEDEISVYVNDECVGSTPFAEVNAVTQGVQYNATKFSSMWCLQRGCVSSLQSYSLWGEVGNAGDAGDAGDTYAPLWLPELKESPTGCTAKASASWTP